jgi:hypothetical protein
MLRQENNIKANNLFFYILSIDTYRFSTKSQKEICSERLNANNEINYVPYLIGLLLFHAHILI